MNSLLRFLLMIWWKDTLPLPRVRITLAHGGILTGHWEFDLALMMVLLAVVAYSFLLPADGPRGAGRFVIQGIALAFFAAALILAVMGFRSL